MGGTMRSPLTGDLFAAELTGNFAALPPLLARRRPPTGSRCC